MESSVRNNSVKLFFSQSFSSLCRKIVHVFMALIMSCSCVNCSAIAYCSKYLQNVSVLKLQEHIIRYVLNASSCVNAKTFFACART